MSLTNVNNKCKQNNEKFLNEINQEADTDDSYETEEEIFSENFSESLIKLQNLQIDKKPKNRKIKKQKKKNDSSKKNVSVQCGKQNRFFKTNKKSQKIIQRKICHKVPVKHKKNLEKPVETSKKGKRCRVGGKAKGEPPEEENQDNNESDEDSENYFVNRISLGFFQQFKDLSGASTSHQWEEDYKMPIKIYSRDKLNDNISEEMELLELQNWGMTKIENLKKLEFLNPDTF